MHDDAEATVTSELTAAPASYTNATLGPTNAGNGRFAPSPTGDFHLGNLRTALLAWALAKRSGRGFVVRMEDLDDRSRPHFADSQLATLETIGITWDSPVVWQSKRIPIYREIANDLRTRGLLYECYCTRRELAEAPSAPHQPPGSYPGTCRFLNNTERSARAAKLTNRGPAWRLATDTTQLTVHDTLLGDYTGTVDDLVIQRGDGVFSYNFVSVIDDGLQSVTQVVRGDDLLPSTPRQVYLQELIGITTPQYAHVPMVFNSAGLRLAKRDGAVTLQELATFGWTAPDVVELLGRTLGVTNARTAEEFCESLDSVNLAQPAYLLDVTSLHEGPQAALHR